MPSKHLIYARSTHNDFTTQWRVFKGENTSPGAGPAGASASAGASGSDSSADGTAFPSASAGGVHAAAAGGRGTSAQLGDRLADLPPFARDIVKLVTGAVAVRYAQPQQSSHDVAVPRSKL